MHTKEKGLHSFVIKMTSLSAVLTIILFLLHNKTSNAIILSMGITFFTIFYHFAMRLFIANFVESILKSKLDYRNKWFQPKSFEANLYEKIKVKKWKDKMPTYNPHTFSLKENTLEEIITTMCVSEIGHTLIFVFSFIPIFFSLFWDAFGVFLITSIISAGFDLLFVIMQRYNRPRLVKLLK